MHPVAHTDHPSAAPRRRDHVAITRGADRHSGRGVLDRTGPGRTAASALEKADVELTLLGVVDGTYNPTVKAQVKTTISSRWDDGDMIYDLDVETYDVLRRTDHAVRRVLVVVALPAEGTLATATEQGTLLLGRARWVCLEGMAATDNTTSTAVTLPGGNTVDEQGLRTMLSTHGVRVSTPVPDVDEWEEGA